MDPRLNRRQALGAFGSVSLGALLTGCGGEDAQPAPTTDSQSQMLDEGNSCSVTAELTEGPYYFDVDAIRRDIREDRKGVELRLVLRVREADKCTPIPNAVVDIWHSDAQGVYSGFDQGEGERFLRGAQVTNDEGVAEFVTIYPGWYQSRTPHIHAKVHLDKRTVLTTQVFFEDKVSAGVYRNPRYVRGSGQQVTNESDGIFDESLLLTTRRRGKDWVGAMTFDVERA